MKFTYTKQTSKYIFKNFFFIFPFVLIPAFFLALSISSDSVSAVVKAFFEGNLSSWNFFDLFCAISVLNFGSIESTLSGLGGIIAILPCVALLMAFLEKHFRIGKRTYNGLWNKLNDNFMSTFLFGLLILVIYELWALIMAAMLFFMSLIPNAIVAYICIVLVFLALHVVFLYALGAIYLWLPCMQITGFPMVESLHYSYQLVAPLRWGIFAEQMYFLLFTEAVVCVCSIFLSHTLTFLLITTATISILFIYYFVRMQVIYFDRDHIERMDLKKY